MILGSMWLSQYKGHVGRYQVRVVRDHDLRPVRRCPAMERLLRREDHHKVNQLALIQEAEADPEQGTRLIRSAGT